MHTKKQTCRRGHAFTTENTYQSRNNKRICLECRRVVQKNWKRNNPDKVAYNRQKWQEANPGKAAEHRRKYNYGLTNDQYLAMLEKQKGQCAICKEVLPLCIDHDHTTGKIRGLLCDKHNKGLGFFNEDPEILQEAVSYLIKGA